MAALVMLGLAWLLTTQAALAVTLPPPPTVPALPLPPPPPVAVPLPQVPRLPAPAVSAPVKADTSSAPAPVHLPAVSGSPSSSSSSSSSAGTSSESYSPGSGAAASSEPTRRPKVKHLRSSRTWIGTNGKKNRRVTTLTFVLERAARVIFTVKQLSPDCATVGRFAVRAHAGLNRVRFAGRVQGQQLAHGTYRLTARTAAGRAVQRVLVVVVDGSAPTRSELMALRSSNVCSATRSTASADGSSFGASSGPSGPSLREDVGRSLAPKERPVALGSEPGGSNGQAGGVLASTVERTVRAVRPALVALLALAILLLGLASLPQVAVADPRFNHLLARHRVEIAGLGTAALLAVAITFLLA